MKEAQGELNMGVVVLGIVGVFTAFFYFTIWPMIRQNLNYTTQCSKAICEGCPSGGCQKVKCYTIKNGVKSEPFECVWKG